MRVHVERIHPRTPDHAAAAAVAGTFGLLAARRELVIASVGWADAPGLGVAPWTLSGIELAARDHALQNRRIELPGTRIAKHKPTGDDARRVAIELPGCTRPRRVPWTWFGAHLCLVAPCVHLRGPDRGARWIGPAENALRALDRACFGAEDAAAGARLASSVFASATLVVDGSWWTPLPAIPNGAPTLFELQRCIALGSTAPSPTWAHDVLNCLDPWIAAKLHLGPLPGGGDTVHTSGSAASAKWPRPPQRAIEHASAGNISGLWATPKAARPCAATVPGALGRLWKAQTR